MKKFIAALLLLLILAMTLFVWGNWIFFSDKHGLVINLIYKVYQLPPIANGLLLLGCFLVGYLIAAFRSLSKRFQSDRTIKSLNEKVASQMEKLSSLRKEVEFLKKNEHNSHTVTPEKTVVTESAEAVIQN